MCHLRRAFLVRSSRRLHRGSRVPCPQRFGDTEADNGKPTYVMHAVHDVLAHSVPNKRAGWSGRIQAAARLAELGLNAARCASVLALGERKAGASS